MMKPAVFFALSLFLGACATTTTPRSIAASGPHPDAPEQLAQYGQLVGSWECQGSNRGQDGNWTESPGTASWVWHYVLDGFAVQDIWVPAAGPQGPQHHGTNLRVYNPDEDKWHMVWTTGATNVFEYFDATYQDGAMVMHGERVGNATRPGHFARITFHDMNRERFLWRYEFAPLSSDKQNWTEVSRLDCRRV